MRPITRSEADVWLLLGMAVGLFGCPLLLEDGFSVGPLFDPDAGDPCIGTTCHTPHSNTGGSSGYGGEGPAGATGLAGTGSAGLGGSGAGAAGSSAVAGAGGAGNIGGSAGSGSAGSSGAPAAGAAGTGSGGAGTAGSGSAGAAGASGEDEACRTLELTDGTHDSTSNCLGIAGTNTIQIDTATTTSLTLSYDNGDPCFAGTIAAAGWGAVYLFNFASDGETWNADAADVSGFEFAYRGSAQPPTVRVMYKDSSGVDNCRAISPGTTAVPFSAAHPSCSTSTSAPVVDSTDMEQMVLAIIPVGGASYPVNFCVQIRALD